MNPIVKLIRPILLLPFDLGINSSTTTYIIAPPASANKYGIKKVILCVISVVIKALIGSTIPDIIPYFIAFFYHVWRSMGHFAAYLQFLDTDHSGRYCRRNFLFGLLLYV